jgi:hypothetical protein
MCKLVHHFSDTIRLPSIIASGELQPSTNRITGYPQDLLWATTSADGDRTSAAMSASGLELWRDGFSEQIRFTLDAKDFDHFSPVIGSQLGWTDDQFNRLKLAAAALGERNTDNWRCRSEPLPLTKVRRVEAKSFAIGKWLEIDLYPDRCPIYEKSPHKRGVRIGQHWYGVTPLVTSEGNDAYEDVVRVSNYFPPARY